MNNSGIAAGLRGGGLVRLGWICLLAGLALGGCRVPEESQWPEVIVLASPATYPMAARCPLDQYKQMLGVRVQLKSMPEGEIVRALEQGAAADVVLLGDGEAWEALKQRALICADPWRFTLTRDRLALVARRDDAQGTATATDLLGKRWPRLAMADSGYSGLGRMTEAYLYEIKFPREERVRLEREERPSAVLKGVLAGTVPAGMIRESIARRRGEEVKTLMTMDPYPQAPGVICGGITTRPKDRRQARRVWGYLEQTIGAQDWGFIKHDED